jgi:hypothetical protein
MPASSGRHAPSRRQILCTASVAAAAVTTPSSDRAPSVTRPGRTTAYPVRGKERIVGVPSRGGTV